jgi:hypothetical protein
VPPGAARARSVLLWHGGRACAGVRASEREAKLAKARTLAIC